MRKKRTTDAVTIIHRRYYDGKPDRIHQLGLARSEDAIGRKIYELRTKAGMSQRELAKLVGTTASVICRLEDADYRGHSVAMLQRIAHALNNKIEIRFVPLKKRVA